MKIIIHKNVGKRLTQITNLIHKNKHLAGDNDKRGKRLYGWVDEFDDLREKYPTEFKQWCDDNGYDHNCNGHDCLA